MQKGRDEARPYLRQALWATSLLVRTIAARRTLHCSSDLSVLSTDSFVKNRSNGGVCALLLLIACIVSGCRLAIMIALSSLTGGAGGAGVAVVFHIVAIYEATGGSGARTIECSSASAFAHAMLTLPQWRQKTCRNNPLPHRIILSAQKRCRFAFGRDSGNRRRLVRAISEQSTSTSCASNVDC